MKHFNEESHREPRKGCPQCANFHDKEETQFLSLFSCAERMTRKIKTLKEFLVKYTAFIEYLDENRYPAIEARAYLEEFKIILNTQGIIKKKFFPHAGIRLKEKIVGKKVKDAVAKRPKQMCPSCLKYHFNSADIPEKCWEKALKGDYTSAREFNNFLQTNNFGHIEGI